MIPFDHAVTELPQLHLDDATRTAHQRMLAALPADPGDRPKRHRLRLIIAGGAVLVIGGAGVGTAAALGAFSQAPTDRGMGSCYTAADLDAPHGDFAVSSTDGIPGDAAGAALELCSHFFGSGFYSATDPDYRDPMVDPNGPATHPVPPLIPCVMDDGSVGVFPGTAETCADLGLPVADLSTTPASPATR